MINTFCFWPQKILVWIFSAAFFSRQFFLQIFSVFRIKTMIFIYISSNSIQHEFFIYLICRTVIKTPEVLIFLDISKMSFRLNGTCLAFQDPAFTLDIGMRSFFQFLPLFIDLHDFVLFGIFFRIILIQTTRFMFTSAAVCTTIYLKGLCISILLFALYPEMPQSWQI